MNLKHVRAWCLALLLPLFAAPGWAVEYYLRVGDIEGESVDRKHDKWIDLFSFHWGLQSMSTGSGTGRLFQSDFSWTQKIDASVPPLFIGVATGRQFDDATMDVAKSGAKSQEVFFQMIFQDVTLTALTLSGGGTETSAQASLTGSKLTMNYWPMDDKGGLGKKVTATFDFKRGVMSGDAMALEGLFLSGGGFDIVPMPAVPEPAAALLLPLGLGVIAWRRHRLHR